MPAAISEKNTSNNSPFQRKAVRKKTNKSRTELPGPVGSRVRSIPSHFPWGFTVKPQWEIVRDLNGRPKKKWIKHIHSSLRNIQTFNVSVTFLFLLHRCTSLVCKCFLVCRDSKYLAKLYYFTNLDFPEIRGFPFLSYLLGFFGRVFGRYNLTRSISWIP